MPADVSSDSSPGFDPYAKERELQSESASWNTSTPVEAEAEDIPLIDLGDYFSNGDAGSRQIAAGQLRDACEQSGFFSIVGHGVPAKLVKETFAMTRQFHALDDDVKRSIVMDSPDWPLGGVGYLPLNNRKLPARERGNLNEAFIVKRDHRIGFDDNRWPAADALPGFRKCVETYAGAIEALGRRLLPVFATALEVAPDFFDAAFAEPLYRLRMTHYPPIDRRDAETYGIAPHVDTTFCTILAQDSPGLTIYSERRQRWIHAPVIDDAFVVNTGELLKIWSNHRFVSVKHFANNNIGAESRYSIPFFLNANSDYRMTCIPSCCDEHNPPRYPPISYNESQAVAQGE